MFGPRCHSELFGHLCQHHWNIRVDIKLYNKRLSHTSVQLSFLWGRLKLIHLGTTEGMNDECDSYECIVKTFKYMLQASGKSEQPHWCMGVRRWISSFGGKGQEVVTEWRGVHWVSGLGFIGVTLMMGLFSSIKKFCLTPIRRKQDMFLEVGQPSTPYQCSHPLLGAHGGLWQAVNLCWMNRELLMTSFATQVLSLGNFRRGTFSSFCFQRRDAFWVKGRFKVW